MDFTDEEFRFFLNYLVAANRVAEKICAAANSLASDVKTVVATKLMSFLTVCRTPPQGKNKTRFKYHVEILVNEIIDVDIILPITLIVS